MGAPTHVEDDRGHAVWLARLDPYGVAEVEADGNFDMPLRFPGHQFDPEIGLHYNRFRYYDPTLGRFLQPDPMGITGAINLYAYSSNPLKEVDLDGLAKHSPKKPARKGKRQTGQDGEETPAPFQVVPRPGMESRVERDPQGRPVTIHGQAENCSSTTPGHGEAMNNQVDRMVQSGDYDSITIQRSWRTATGRESSDRAIPDVIGNRRDGRVDAFEVASKTDDPAALQQRLDSSMNTLPPQRQGTTTVLDPEPE